MRMILIYEVSLFVSQVKLFLRQALTIASGYVEL